jgi:site-specific DNA recombinase
MSHLVLRAAIYSRYSSDLQSPSSIEDQLRKCREFAARQGWAVLDRHVYRDAALSGATDARPGLKQLLSAALSKPAPFDIVLADDTSRLSRRMSDSLRISERLKFAGVRLVFVSQGIDTESEQAEVLLATHGIVDSLYIRELAKKVYRGVEGRALQKLHTGGRCFGYRSVPIEDSAHPDPHGRPAIVGARLEIATEEAEVVRRIFTLYASGHSLKNVAKRLNAEGVASPQPRKGRPQSWCPSSIRTILHNERYRGVVSWGRTRKERDPQTGRRVNRRRPLGDWVRAEIPEQRILPEELWCRVQQRIEHVKSVYGDAGRKGGLLRARTASSPYLFSGLLKCALCGASMTLVAGRGRNHRQAQYGCPMNAGRGTCTNRLRIGREDLEQALLSYLQGKVLREEVVEYTLERFERELKRAFKKLDGEVELLRQRRAEIEKRLANYMRAIGVGHYSTTVMGEVATCEKELAEISDRLLGRRADSVAQKMQDVRTFALSRLTALRALLCSDALTAKAVISEHVHSITLEPDGRAYRVSGTWDLLGSGRMEGAGGQS